LEPADRQGQDRTLPLDHLHLHREWNVPGAKTPRAATRGLACFRGQGVDRQPPSSAIVAVTRRGDGSRADSYDEMRLARIVGTSVLTPSSALPVAPLGDCQ
jgi:hypothetical protein